MKAVLNTLFVFLLLFIAGIADNFKDEPMPDIKMITKPCNNCPYRKDAPTEHWHKEEFKKVLDAEDDPIGKVFKCHKNNGCVCAGWLTDQDRRNFPSIALRLELSKQGTTRTLLDKLEKNKGLYPSIEAMVQANFPELLKYKTK